MSIAKSAMHYATGEAVEGLDQYQAPKKRGKGKNKPATSATHTPAYTHEDGETLQIREDKRNYRRHGEKNLSLIGRSLDDFGAGRSIVADNSGQVIGGNGTLREANKRGIPKRIIHTTGDELVVVVRDDIAPDDPRRQKLAIMDNSTTDTSEFEYMMLQEDFSIPELEDMGIEIPEDMLAIDDGEGTSGETEPDAVPEIEEEPVSVRGKVYQLGKHRLMCGDSTSAEDVALLMQGEKADMVFTDPPYGMKKEKDGVLNDNLNFDDLLEFNKKWIPLSFDNTKENGSWYCWGIDEPLMDIYSNILKPMIKENKITFRNLITWKKENDNPTMLFNGACSSNKRSYYTNEKCLFVMCGVQGFNNNADNYFDGFEPIRAYFEAECEKCGGHKIWKQMLGNNMGHHYFTKSQWCFPTKEAYEKMQAFGKEYGAFGKEYEEIKKEYEEIKKEWYEKRAYFDGNKDQCIDVWLSDVTSQKERQFAGGHATPKPIALCARGIKSSSRESEVVLDVFGGSGSTLIACEQLKRKCRMMELDEHYCDVIRKRWAKYVHGEGCDWQSLTPEVK